MIRYQYLCPRVPNSSPDDCPGYLCYKCLEPVEVTRTLLWIITNRPTSSVRFVCSECEPQNAGGGLAT